MDSSDPNSNRSSQASKDALGKDLSRQISRHQIRQNYDIDTPSASRHSTQNRLGIYETAALAGLDPPIVLGAHNQREAPVAAADLESTAASHRSAYYGKGMARLYGRGRAISAAATMSPPPPPPPPEESTAESIKEEAFEARTFSLPILTKLCRDSSWLRLEHKALASNLWNELHRRKEKCEVHFHGRIWDDATSKHVDLSMGKGPKSSPFCKRMAEAVMEAGFDGEGEARGEDENDMMERLLVMEGVLALFVEGNKTAGKKGVFDEDC